MRSTTPGQTVGPFFHFGLEYDGDNEIVPPATDGAVRLHGHVYDGAGDGVPDAMVEIWQPDPAGAIPHGPGSLRRDGWSFSGFGRACTEADGHYSFTTLRPGPTEPGAASFFALTVFARGLLDRLFTRAYLPDSPALVTDPFLANVPADRRPTLVAAADETGFEFDVHLQGENETIFLQFPDE